MRNREKDELFDKFDPRKKKFLVKATREMIEFLNERPAKLRVVMSHPTKVTPTKGQWSIELAHPDWHTDHSMPTEWNILHQYKRALVKCPDAPPLVVFMHAPAVQQGRRIVRHPVAILPLTVLLDRLKEPSIAENPWSL